MKKLILISGKAMHGKTTFANYLKKHLEEHGKRVCIVNYASHLKNIAKAYYGWDGKDKSEKWRNLLQQLGTDRIRVQMNKPFFHAHRMCEDIEIIQDDFDYIISDDMRFKNELYYPMAYFPNKVMTVRVHRYNFVSPLTKEQQLHASEIDLDGIEMNEDIRVYSGEVDYLSDEAKCMCLALIGEEKDNE